ALFAVSWELGAITAGASLDKRNSLIQFGKHLGLAFQIVDDLLDLRSSTEKLGKKAGKDAEAGKQTYPSVIGEQASEDRAEEKIKTAVDALKIFGESAKPLEFIANFVVSRKL
ncbi:MAG: polyprenyl synthetase family protein, partial [Planctomycetota bacterium]